MADHDLIDAYVRALARQLPVDVVDELADGLDEAYRRYLAATMPADAAARAAVAEFGPVDLVVRAFVSQAPGRRAARALLATGPAVGACWGVALISEQAWTAALPLAARIAFGAAVVAVVITLALAASARHNYRRTRAGVVASVGLLALDGTAVTSVLIFGPSPSAWLLAAASASSARMACVGHAFPRIARR